MDSYETFQESPVALVPDGNAGGVGEMLIEYAHLTLLLQMTRPPDGFGNFDRGVDIEGYQSETFVSRNMAAGVQNVWYAPARFP